MLREVGEAGPDRPRPPRAGRRPDRHGGAARACRARASPTSSGELVMLELALVRWALEKLRGHGFEPVIPPVLVREEALYGTGFLPDTEQQIYRLADDDLYLVGHERGRARVAARRRDPRRRRAAAALRRLLAVLPPRGGRRGQGHARDLPRAPVRQGRDVRVRRARATSRRGARAAARDRGGDPAASWGCPTASSNIAVDDLGARAAQEVRPRGVAARAGAATAS